MLAAWLRQREADSVFITSYRLQANVAGLTDNGKSKFGLRVRTLASSSLAACLRKAEREESMKLRRRVNVETNQKQYKFILLCTVLN